MYTIDLNFYTLWVIVSTIGEFSIEDKSDFYVNNELIKLVQEIIRLDEIKNYSLPLNQEIYERDILNL